MIVRNLNAVLEKKQKIKICILLVLMIGGALLETMGVTLIIPLISVVMSPNLIHENRIMAYFYELFCMQNDTQFLIFIILALMAVYLLKNIYMWILYYIQAKFIANNQFRMSKKLLTIFMRRPYEYYLNASTGDIIRIIQWDVGNVFMLINNALLFLSEMCVLIALVILLIVVDPFMTIAIACMLGVVMMICKKTFQKYLVKAGETSQKYSSIMNKWLLQSLEGIKEIKIHHNENHFIKHYEKSGIKNAVAQRSNNIFSQTPRLIIEAVCMCGMLGIVAFLVMSGREIGGMMTLMSTFAMAAVRLMPSANRMNTYLNAISFLEPSLNTVMENINAFERENVEKEKNSTIKELKFQKSIEVEQIQYAYPNVEKNLFDNVNMSIPVGKSIAIIGASGAGKTTIVDIILGLLYPQKGKITIDGIDIQEDYYGWLNKIGYIPQTIFMLDDTVKNNIAFGLQSEDIDEVRVWKALEDAQLSEHIRSLPEGINTEIGEKGVRFSGGQRQRLGIARALYHNPEILIFDEATSALDNDTEAAIMESINRFQGEKTMIIIAHRLETIKNCDLVYRVEKGKIVLEKENRRNCDEE